MKVMDVYTQTRMIELSRFWDFIDREVETMDDLVQVGKCVDYLSQNEQVKAEKINPRLTRRLIEWAESQEGWD